MRARKGKASQGKVDWAHSLHAYFNVVALLAEDGERESKKREVFVCVKMSVLLRGWPQASVFGAWRAKGAAGKVLEGRGGDKSG